MRLRVLAASCIVSFGAVCGCTQGDVDDLQLETTTTSSDASPQGDEATACELLQGIEFSRIPDAIEFQGLDGSLRYLRQRSGVNVGGDALVFLQPEHALRLDEIEDELAEIAGVSVVDTLSQEEAYQQFRSMFGERGTESITPSVLPPAVAVDLSGGDARSAIEAFKNTPEIYDVIFRDEVGARLLASVRLVREQFESELRQLSDVGPSDVREAASTFAALGSPEGSPATFPLEVISTVEVLIAFADESCPS